jgi:hypothetical protein
MATCRYCGRGGLLRHVNTNGLCDGCAPAVEMSIRSKVRVVSESLVLAQNGKTLATRLGRWDLVIERSRQLLLYEVRGIPTMEPLPSALIGKATIERQKAIVVGVLDAIDAAQAKPTTAQQRRALDKIPRLIDELSAEYGADPEIEAALSELAERIDVLAGRA